MSSPGSTAPYSGLCLSGVSSPELLSCASDPGLCPKGGITRVSVCVESSHLGFLDNQAFQHLVSILALFHPGNFGGSHV